MKNIKNIMKCTHHNLVKSIDVAQIKNKSVELEVETCKKCGEVFISSKETEKVRKIAHPSLLKRIKGIFGKPKLNINILRGKVL